MSTKRPSARQRLLETADRLFYAEGVHTVGIDRIIEEAGVAKGSLFYNFSGKDALVAAYLEGRHQRRRERTEHHLKAVSDPVEKLLAVFDTLDEVAHLPTYRGCPFANASVEAAAGSAELAALESYRTWLREMLLSLAVEAGYDDPASVADRLRLLYDGAVANAQLDSHPEAVRLAKELARTVLESSPRS
jgi:AcrR family transcriptional regulator